MSNKLELCKKYAHEYVYICKCDNSVKKDKSVCIVHKHFINLLEQDV